MKKVFSLLLVILLSNWAVAQITDYSIFDKKFNFYVANDLGRNGYYDQKPIAELMGAMAEEIGPEFVVATGDIHHFEGVRSVNDPLWMTNYELIYSHPELMIDWFPVLGNHEYRGNTRAVLDYTNISRRWTMPARYYTKAFEDIKRNLQYIHFDAGWYGFEYDKASDATTVTLDPRRNPKIDALNLKEVVAYAKQHGIGVMLYVNQRALQQQLDEILPLYKSWGISGIKFGFVQVGSQVWTKWMHEAVKKCADYGLMVDIHDEYRPTGFSRTYPNLMTQEGIRGNEISGPIISTLFHGFVHPFCPHLRTYLHKPKLNSRNSP